MIITINDMFSHVEFNKESAQLKALICKQFHKKLGVHEKGYQYSRLYKKHIWDGIIDFYSAKTGNFPTGLVDQVEDILQKVKANNPSLNWVTEDKRSSALVDPHNVVGDTVRLQGDITLFDYQREALIRCLTNRVGMVNIATNGGKSIIEAAVINALLPYIGKDEYISFTCFSKEIFYQIIDNFEKWLGIKVGKLGDGHTDIRRVTVALVPTLNRALQDPAKKVKLTSEKDRFTKKMATKIAPLFVDKVNQHSLVTNFLKSYYPKSRIDGKIKDVLLQVSLSNMSDSRINKAMKQYQKSYYKLIEKKAGKAFTKYNEVLHFVKNAKVLLTDESHHCKSKAYYEIMLRFSHASYRLGFSGTITSEDKVGWQRLQSIFHKKIIVIDNDNLIGKGISAKPTIYTLTITEPYEIVNRRGQKVSFENMKNWQEVYKLGIVHNDVRNKLLATVAYNASVNRKDRGVLIVVNQVEQGKDIAKQLSSMKANFTELYGDMPTDVRQSKLDDFKSGKTSILIATSLIDEGVSINRVGVLVLAGGGKSYRQVIQRIGRAIRKKEGDNTCIIFDTIDRTNWYLFNHSRSRIKIYKDEGFEIESVN